MCPQSVHYTSTKLTKCCDKFNPTGSFIHSFSQQLEELPARRGGAGLRQGPWLTESTLHGYEWQQQTLYKPVSDQSLIGLGHWTDGRQYAAMADTDADSSVHTETITSVTTAA